MRFRNLPAVRHRALLVGLFALAATSCSSGAGEADGGAPITAGPQPETTAPADKPAETRTSEAKPASEEPAAKPADIGPRVVPVARPVEAAGDAKPAEKGAQ